MSGGLRSERGWALVTAVMVMALMMTTGLAAFAYVDTEQKQARGERVSESAFGLSEGVLSSQGFILGRRWPAVAANAFPASCTQATVNVRCPDPTRVRASFNQPDYAAQTTWVTTVRDNGDPAAANQPTPYYDPSLTPTQPAWDANGDGSMWVRAEATVRGRTRRLVTRIGLQKIEEQFPRNVITAGSFDDTNAGAPKVFVNTKGQPLAVRCTNSADRECVDIRRAIHVSPYTIETGYASPTALDPQALSRLRDRAIAEGSYYPTCPSNPPGTFVFVEAGNCGGSSLPATTVGGVSGVFILVSGCFGDPNNYFGLIYLANLTSAGAQWGSSDDGCFTLGPGAGTMTGAVAVDGPGGFSIVSGAAKLVYDDTVFSQLYSYGSSGSVRNSFRELKG